MLTGKYNKGSIPSDSRFALENYKVYFIFFILCHICFELSLLLHLIHLLILQNLANRSLVDDVLKKVSGLKPIADELGVTLAQLAIAWCASNPNVSSVITGATRESQVSSSLGT